MTAERQTVPLEFYRRSATEMLDRASGFRQLMDRRRSVRSFSSQQPAPEVLTQCLHTAGTAPSGANRQPWHFALVQDPKVKREIRLGAEAEEREFYQRRAPADWLQALEPLGTDADKPYLEEAPALIVIFGQKYGFDAAGEKIKNYYVPESVGIATGFLIAALHNAGLATLTHTPSPMRFLNRILERPDNEKPTVILVAGFPAEDCEVPAISRKLPDSYISHF